eukprot:gb/GECG01009561.1/.p1 GENE.gb/GECG01009561.1/~~gb/GECG01009561.1/.p1  ORF type:complete len:414 (+),score=63.66 gb/GECG01009561.1/:1-1242(+)
MLRQVCFQVGRTRRWCLYRPLATVASGASTKPDPPPREGSGKILMQGSSNTKVPGKIKRLVESKPTSVEGRIRKMLELEKFTKQTGIRLQLRQTKEWYIPPLDSELQQELENLESPEQHPGYWKSMGGYHMFRRNAADWYRNLRVLIRGDGPPQCRISVFHELLENIKSEADVPYVKKAMNTCRQRHLEFDARSPAKIVEALCRNGATDQAIEILRQADYWRLFPTSATYARAMKYAAAENNVELMRRIEDLMMAKQLRWHDGAVYSYVRGMLENDEVCNAVAALNRARRKGDKIPSAPYTLLLDYVANKLEHAPLDCDSALRRLLKHTEQRNGNDAFKKARSSALEARADLFREPAPAAGNTESTDTVEGETATEAEDASAEAQEPTTDENAEQQSPSEETERAEEVPQTKE